MKFNDDIKVFGDINYRGKCPAETAEQITFFNWLRKEYPEYGAIAIHPRNEGKRTNIQAMFHKAEGMTSGASDIIIPANPAFVCEMKRRDHTKSNWEEGQEQYLIDCKKQGAFVCVALGANGAKEAILEWKKTQQQ